MGLFDTKVTAGRLPTPRSSGMKASAAAFSNIAAAAAKQDAVDLERQKQEFEMTADEREMAKNKRLADDMASLRHQLLYDERQKFLDSGGGEALLAGRAQEGRLFDKAGVNQISESGGRFGLMDDHGEILNPTNTAAEDAITGRLLQKADDAEIGELNPEEADRLRGIAAPRTGLNIQGDIDGHVTRLTEKLFQDPSQFIQNVGDAEATLLQGLQGRGHDLAASQGQVNQFLDQHFPKASGETVNKLLDLEGKRKGALENLSGFIKGGSGTKGSGGYLSKFDINKYDSNARSNSEFITEWAARNPKIKQGSRGMFSFNVGREEVFTDDVKKYVFELNTLGVSTPTAMNMLDGMIEDGTTDFHIGKMSKEKINELAKIGLAMQGENAGAIDQIGGIEGVLALAASDDAGRERRIKSILATGTRRGGDPSKLFLNEGELNKSNLSLGSAPTGKPVFADGDGSKGRTQRAAAGSKKAATNALRDLERTPDQVLQSKRDKHVAEGGLMIGNETLGEFTGFDTDAPSTKILSDYQEKFGESIEESLRGPLGTIMQSITGASASGFPPGVKNFEERRQYIEQQRAAGNTDLANKMEANWEDSIEKSKARAKRILNDNPDMEKNAKKQLVERMQLLTKYMRRDLKEGKSRSERTHNVLLNNFQQQEY